MVDKFSLQFLLNPIREERNHRALTTPTTTTSTPLLQNKRKRAEDESCFSIGCDSDNDNTYNNHNHHHTDDVINDDAAYRMDHNTAPHLKRAKRERSSSPAERAAASDDDPQLSTTFDGELPRTESAESFEEQVEGYHKKRREEIFFVHQFIQPPHLQTYQLSTSHHHLSGLPYSQALTPSFHLDLPAGTHNKSSDFYNGDNTDTISTTNTTTTTTNNNRSAGPVKGEATFIRQEQNFSYFSYSGNANTTTSHIVHEDCSQSHLPYSADSFPTRHPPQEKKKRKRTTPEQTAFLEYFFKSNPRPDSNTKYRIAQHLCLAPQQVNIWYAIFPFLQHKNNKLSFLTLSF